ncbi:hypothetical protein RhiJN_26719 [Ceratobasidium sp. AG-Ba]|nr:hypothetical protein RhiJN_12670 [Ceratobasidium sp. AG-Ba]QRV98700.1 hypothetical protein RhiJN_26719 [Ceratobasidium sp. AG-Ba]
MATKTLNFYTYNLQKDTTVMLMFDPPSSQKLFKDQFPVVWKVITFRAGGHAKAVVRYTSRLAFGYAQLDDANAVDAAAWVEVKSGDMTSIKGNNGEKRFGGVSKRENTRLLVCKNNTNQRAHLSIGFVKGDGIDQRFDPVLLWTGVGAKSNVTAQFTPRLSAYVTRDYQGKWCIFSTGCNPNHSVLLPESQFLRGEVETEAIWTMDLNTLDDLSSWNFVENPESGSFEIKAAGQL